MMDGTSESYLSNFDNVLTARDAEPDGQGQVSVCSHCGQEGRQVGRHRLPRPSDTGDADTVNLAERTTTITTAAAAAAAARKTQAAETAPAEEITQAEDTTEVVS